MAGGQDMQRPSSRNNSISAAHCTLLQRLSQDFLDKTPSDFNAGCDSSDCLFCQGQRQFCNQAFVNSTCSWLRDRRLSFTSQGGCITCAPSDGGSLENAVQPHTLQQQPQPQHNKLRPGQEQLDEQRQRKRLKASPVAGSTDSWQASARTAASIGGPVPADGSHLQQLQQPVVQQQQQQHVTLCHTPFAAGGRVWQWQPEFAALSGPAPARFAEVARLQSPGEAVAGHNCALRCDRITGLEFSTDGQLLAAASVSKQIGLYSMAALNNPSEWVAAGDACEPAQGFKCSSSTCQQAHHQQQLLSVPVLPAMATVRLPSKVSSIAWSPDMPGVISVGDFDGTLTQVHVASGHYLNEVDAHAGRRIWSVCHSQLRRHLALTASDDCTAKLWAGSGLNTQVATLTAPGRPALCGADFSSSCDTLLALAAADARVYLYDLRQLSTPLVTLHSHRRPVSYAKFFGPSQLVSASIDGTLAVWDLGPLLGMAATGAAARTPANSDAGSSFGSQHQLQPSTGMRPRASETSGNTAGSSNGGNLPAQCGNTSPSAGAAIAPETAALLSPQHCEQPWKVFRGHTNEKHFIGLSVDPSSGLLAVGSETSEVFTYHTSWDTPLARFDVCQQPAAAAAQAQQQQVHQQMQQPVAVNWSEQQSVSAVAWQPLYDAAAGSIGSCSRAASLLAAATSAGQCRLLSLLKP